MHPRIGYWRFFLVLFTLPSFACVTQPFSGKNLLTGKYLEISPDKQPKGTVVVFLSAKCPCSQSHEAKIEKLSRDFKEFSFVAVHSNADETPEIARQHFGQGGISFPILQDVKAKIADQFGALKTPHAFVIGPKGECLFNGGVDDSQIAATASKEYLRVALESVRLGKVPEQQEARTLGCVITR